MHVRYYCDHLGLGTSNRGLSGLSGLCLALLSAPGNVSDHGQCAATQSDTMGFAALPAGRAQKIGPGGLELFNVKVG